MFSFRQFVALKKAHLFTHVDNFSIFTKTYAEIGNAFFEGLEANWRNCSGDSTCRYGREVSFKPRSRPLLPKTKKLRPICAETGKWVVQRRSFDSPNSPTKDLVDLDETNILSPGLDLYSQKQKSYGPNRCSAQLSKISEKWGPFRGVNGRLRLHRLDIRDQGEKVPQGKGRNTSSSNI